MNPPRPETRKAQPPAPSPGLSERALVVRLIDWFCAHARDLPWRRTDDPYAIWVSEIMLQQTQVKTVLPYYRRWMKHLPGVVELAAASSDQLHKFWQGLGYYSRVRNMRKAARLVVARHGGIFPQRHEDVLDLPGIGPYTAGAICSIAFGQPTPVLDGNITRVLARLYTVGGQPVQKRTNRRLWHLATCLVTEASNFPGATNRVTRPAIGGGLGSPCSQLNQALMELGALICLPRQPRCDQCPVARFCGAHRTGRVDSLPRRRARPKATRRHFIAFLVQHRGRYLVRQRPAGTVNAHLWEFPNVEPPAPPAKLDALASTALGFQAHNFAHACTVKHSITRYRITLDAYHARVGSQHPSHRASTSRWLALPQLENLAFTAAHHKLVVHLRGR